MDVKATPADTALPVTSTPSGPDILEEALSAPTESAELSESSDEASDLHQIRHQSLPNTLTTTVAMIVTFKKLWPQRTLFLRWREQLMR